MIAALLLVALVATVFLGIEWRLQIWRRQDRVAQRWLERRFKSNIVRIVVSGQQRYFATSSPSVLLPLSRLCRRAAMRRAGDGWEYTARITLANATYFRVEMFISRRHISFLDAYHDYPRFSFNVRVPRRPPPGMQRFVNALAPQAHLQGG